jgi:hypothetical protein
MKKIISIFIVLLFICSCGTGLGIRKSKVKTLDKGLTGTFQNAAFKTHGKRYGTPTLLTLFEIQNVNTDSLSIKFNDRGELKITYKDKMS